MNNENVNQSHITEREESSVCENEACVGFLTVCARAAPSVVPLRACGPEETGGKNSENQHILAFWNSES